MKKCCDNCKYGNYCPFGGEDLYCMKDYKFSNKSALCDLFNDFNVQNDIFENKVREKKFYCDAYERINHNEYYTYNDCGL